MILQLNPPIPVVTPNGKALAHFLIDEGVEHHLYWVCIQNGSGECWTFSNPSIRGQQNITQGREHISPFYNPDSVAFPPDEKIEDEDDDSEYVTCDWEKLYEECREKLHETLENFKDLKQSYVEVEIELGEMKNILKKLLKDDHIFPGIRNEIELFMSKKEQK